MLGAQQLLLTKPRLRLLPSHGNSWDGLLGLHLSAPAALGGMGVTEDYPGLCLDHLQGAGRLASEGVGRGPSLSACAPPTSFTSMLLYSLRLRYSSTRINKEI